MAFVQGRTADDVSTLAYNSNVTAGNLRACHFSFDASETVTGVTGDGTWSLAIGITNTPNSQRSEIWYKENATGGATTGPTITGPATFRRLSIIESNNVASSAALDRTGAAIGASTTPSSGSVTPIANGQYLLGGLQAFSVTITPGSGWAARVTDVNQEAVLHDQTQTSAAAVAMNPTLSGSQNWAALIATFKPAVASPSPVKGLPRSLSVKRQLRTRR